MSKKQKKEELKEEILEAKAEKIEEKKIEVKSYKFDRNVYHNGVEYKKDQEYTGKDYNELKDYLV